jgi:hypothetical protein
MTQMTKLCTYVLIGLICNTLSCANNTQAIKHQGRWIAGDMHIHTALSADAKSSLSQVLHTGFTQFGLDYMAISNHLRNSSRDNFGREDIQLLFSDALARYELPALQNFQKDFADKLIISSFEWDAPTHEHMNIGKLSFSDDVGHSLEFTRYFEYRFGAKNTLRDFPAAVVEDYQKQGVLRQNSTHQDAVSALTWLQENHRDSSYATLNHPTRYATSYKMSDIREFNDAAPDVLFLVEGMVGNQFNGERGDYSSASRSGLLGGVDPFVAELGGNWDALLGEGRHLWNIANSDHHFKISLPYSSGYFPGEYAKTYVWLPTELHQPLQKTAWLNALKSGNSFSVFGDLINALDFHISSQNNKATMGQTLTTQPQQSIEITIRFKQPKHNNHETQVGNGQYKGLIPELHHIDLIAGDISAKSLPNTSAYNLPYNSTTRVIHSFTANEWQLDDQGYYVMRYTIAATRDQYFRLRGTNLNYNEKGLTIDGEPQRSEVIKLDKTGGRAYYQRINERNYKDLWFYSNPIFTRLD